MNKTQLKFFDVKKVITRQIVITDVHTQKHGNILFGKHVAITTAFVENF